MAGGKMQRTIPSEDLKSMLRDESYIKKILDRVMGNATEVLGNEERVQDLSKLLAHIERYFKDRSAVTKLDALQEGSITLRGFFCVLMNSLAESEIETCLRWCRQYRAQDLFREFLGGGQTGKSLDIEDVRVIFRAMDTDGSGMVTVEELVEGGLEEAEACELLRRLGEGENGELSEESLQGILRSVDTSLRFEFKNCFQKKAVEAPL